MGLETVRELWFALTFPLFMVFLLQGGSCQGSPDNKGPQHTTGRLAAGVWGGNHIRMNVTDNGAEVEYDCAHGSIDDAIVLRDDATFEARGVHVTERPGPVREGQEGKREAVLYTGKVEGETMTLTVIKQENSETIGTYKLAKGSHGRVHKCM